MKPAKYIIKITFAAAALLMATACHDLLDEPAENRSFTGETDYTITSNMIQPLIGAYADLYARGWEDFPLISVRGDDVNAGGLGDQQDYAETDKFNYNKDYWMYNSMWQNFYKDIFTAHSAMEQIELYRENASGATNADQYIAEAKTIRGWLLFELSRVWGSVFITTSSDPSDLLVAGLSTKDEVMQHISDQMDEAIPFLPNMHPNERTDIPGGMTRYTALAIKALANLELENNQELFKIPGKLSVENVMELQYSDFGQGSGDSKSYLFAFFGPQGWTPAVDGAGSGWGFYEPSMKYIKFMLDRGETVRLETSVLFTNRGIAEIKKDPNYATLPAWISNTTRSGDVINDYARAMFASGKQYLPSIELIPGRTSYGSNNNFRCIRYSEILLMHAEALTMGATGSSITALQAVNQVRERAGLDPLGSVNNDQVMDEKFAELAMEWGTRYYDMIRLNKTSELSYDGRTFTADKTFLPYPQNQVDQLPALGEAK